MRGKQSVIAGNFSVDVSNSLAIGAINGEDRNSSDRRFGWGQWAKSSTFGRFASGHGGNEKQTPLQRSACSTACQRLSDRWARPRNTKCAASSTNTESNRERPNEVAGCQKINRHRRPQDQRELGRRVLEGAQGNRSNAKHSIVRSRVDHRQRTPARQSVVGDSVVCS